MKPWKPGDIAVIDVPGKEYDLKLCILRRLYESPNGSNDFLTETGIIPKAWIVQLGCCQRIDCVLVAEQHLVRTEDRNKKGSWVEDCPFQPLEYLKYP